MKFDLNSRVVVGEKHGTVVGRLESLDNDLLYEVQFDEPGEGLDRTWIGESAMEASKKPAPKRAAKKTATAERVPMARTRPAPVDPAVKAAKRARRDAMRAHLGVMAKAMVPAK